MKKFFAIALARILDKHRDLIHRENVLKMNAGSDYSESITLLDVAKESVPKNSFDLVENIKSNIKIKKTAYGG